METLRRNQRKFYKQKTQQLKGRMNDFDGLILRLNIAKERISKCEGRATGISRQVCPADAG